MTKIKGIHSLKRTRNQRDRWDKEIKEYTHHRKKKNEGLDNDSYMAWFVSVELIMFFFYFLSF